MKDNIIKDFFIHLTNYIAVGLLWFFISALGLFITLGAATTAAFRVVFKLSDHRIHTDLFKTFFKSFKDNFITATILYLLIVLLTLGLFFIYNFAVNTDRAWLGIMVIVSAIELGVFTLYVFPLIARFEHHNIFALIKNTVLMQHMHLWTTFKLMGSAAFFVLLTMRVDPSFFALGIALYFALATYHLNPLFNHYIQAIEEENHA